MVTNPTVWPVTIPVPLPTVAKTGAPLLHIPPVTVSDSAIVEPMHTCDGPSIGAGEELTATA